ncbi:olfactory receptor [Crotalus adamanteus]|uniref:Olfactory receptor n=1 Tax=Crotalus adamanteus TaxID=8729 RepID=A0AAW1B5X7_CROAD
MIISNKIIVIHFIISGFPSLKNFQFLLFFVGLLIYVLTLNGHLIIISIVYIDRHLHIPMYFFLSNFFLEIWYTSNIIPKMLEVFLTKNKYITYTGCIAQLYFLISFGIAECFIVAIMAFDRYLAICNPLRYQNLMNNNICHQMAACSWIGAFLINIPPLVALSRLPFCGPNEINHFSSPLLKLSCVNPHEAELFNFIVATSVIVSSFSLILVSYILIIVTILKIPSTTGRGKAFSTCGSHLAVVAIFYGTLMFMYVCPTSKTLNSSVIFNKIVSVFYTVVTPMLSPIIFCLRYKEVKKALKRVISRKHGLTMKQSCIRKELMN